MRKDILIVDDDETICEFMLTILKNAGYNVDVADTAIHALKKATKEIYPVIVTDIMMPDMDGLQLLSEIKKANFDTQVIMVTASTSLDYAITALREGAASYIKKPFEAEELISQVKLSYQRYLNIEDNKQLIKHLMHAKEYNEKVIENLVYTLIIFDEKGNIKKINHAMENLLNYKCEELVGRPLSTILSDEYKKIQWPKLINQKKVSEHLVDFVEKNGSKIKVAFSGTIMKDTTGNIIGFIGTAKNLNE